MLPIHEAKITIKYLQDKERQRNPSKPFFMMIGMNPPHNLYNSLQDCMEEDFYLFKNIPTDSLLIRLNADTQRKETQSARFYFASITGIDRAFGMIIKDLKETLFFHDSTDPYQLNNLSIQDYTKSREGISISNGKSINTHNIPIVENKHLIKPNHL